MIYENIRALCEGRGTTIAELEKVLGFGCSTIVRWKEADPGARKLKRVADYFEVSVDNLIDAEDCAYVCGTVQ